MFVNVGINTAVVDILKYMQVDYSAKLDRQGTF